MYSNSDKENRYQSITITYILLRSPSLREDDYIFYVSDISSLTSIDTLSTFFPGAHNKCAFGLSKIKTGNLDDNPTSLKVTPTGSTAGLSVYTLTTTGISELTYRIVCIDKCIEADKYPNYVVGTATCSICSAVLSNCSVCNSSITCTGCNSGYFVNYSIPHACLPCSSPCITCTSQSFCMNCTNNSFLLVVSSTNQSCVSCLQEC